MSGNGQMWIAEIETRHTKSRGFGASPEEAVQALVDLWRDKWVPQSEADPDYLHEYRDDISVNPFALGTAYLIGPGDDLWHKKGVRGSDSRFDGLLAPLSPAP